MKYLIALIGVILVALSIANSVDAVQPEAQVEVVSYTVCIMETLSGLLLTIMRRNISRI